ncbi:MAG: hypothetical protein ACYDER_22360 [Ktedonobacteraceae bacterium]
MMWLSMNMSSWGGSDALHIRMSRTSPEKAAMRIPIPEQQRYGDPK